MTTFKSSGIRSDSNIFKKEINIKPAGIATPLQSSESDKGLIRLNYQAADQIKDNFRNMILTNKGERLGRFDYGCNLRKLVTELNNIENFERQVMDNISESTRRYMPMIELDSFSSSYNDDSDQEVKNIVVTVLYSIPLLGLTNQKIDITLYVV